MKIGATVDVSRALRRLDTARTEVRRAAVDALNRTAEQARTATVRDITGTFNLQAGFVRDRIDVRKAVFRGDRLESALVVRGNRSFNLIRFVERKVSLSAMKRRRKAGALGVYAKVKKSGGFKLVKGAFIGNKGRTVFRRIGDGRLPIEPVQTVGIGQAMLSNIGQRKLQQAVRQVFEPNLRAQLKRRGVVS